MRFAFYGRTSTADYQDSVSPRAWQLEIARSVTADRGDVVVEFFDVGWSREVAWERRPQAAALLAAARGSRRPFDAVVVGEFEHAFSARQFISVAEALAHHGILVWLPEVDGPVDPADPVHRALVALLGAKAKHEVVRRVMGLGRDAGADDRAGPVLGRPAAVRLSAGGSRATPEAGGGCVG